MLDEAHNRHPAVASGGESVSEIVKSKILEPNTSRCFEPIPFERTSVAPMSKDSAIHHGGYVIRQSAQRDAIQGDLFRIYFQKLLFY